MIYLSVTRYTDFSCAPGGLPHQSRSYPGGSGGTGSMGRLFTRNSSVSSQSSLEGASGPPGPPGPSVHRGSSSQIRAFGPDGRYHHHRDPLHAASSYPPSRSSRLLYYTSFICTLHLPFFTMNEIN